MKNEEYLKKTRKESNCPLLFRIKKVDGVDQKMKIKKQENPQKKRKIKLKREIYVYMENEK